MIFSLFHRNQPQPTIERLYGAIVAQARRPAFYTDFAVPDTIEGRFELLLLHTFLICHRLKNEGDEGKDVAQAVFDSFLDDMDRTLREMGVGDLSVPKRMKKIGQAFYGRTAVYDEALAGGEDGLAVALARNVLECEPQENAPARLAAYVREAVSRLSEISLPELMRTENPFPVPASSEDRAHA